MFDGSVEFLRRPRLGNDDKQTNKPLHPTHSVAQADPALLTITTSLLFYKCFYYFHYHHRYHYSCHHFIINILCYAPSVFTCIVGGAIQMTVYIYITLHYNDITLVCCTLYQSINHLLMTKGPTGHLQCYTKT